ncbi:MAG: DUF3604 domain-containing protein [Oceanospirillaceae bacterium]|nr:DUF3604 domain-containing protein [Oceanospirillaceae bacterium]
MRNTRTPLLTVLATVMASAPFSAWPEAAYPEQVYWGDTHLHTSNSFDVYLFGTPNSTPDTAYRYAKGLPVINPTTGTRWQMSRPLDFLVVADHAELLGSVYRLFNGDESLRQTKTGKAMLELAPDRSEEQLQEIYDAFNYAASNQENKLGASGKDLYDDLHGGDKRTTAWHDYIETAERHNEPGKFTALIGFEWSSNTNGGNLHRVVFQAEGGDVAKQYIPYSYLESDDPEDLWKWLETTSDKTGATFVAMPHNSNISIGQMFPMQRVNGEPVDADYARARMKWEPVLEVTQIKGDSEAHPALSPNDEFADFETYDFALTPDGARPEPTKADYVRNGLMRGLELEQKLGVNPYKYGMGGSTDSHTGISAVQETNFAGKGQHDSTPERRTHKTGIGSSMGWDMAAAGYVGVWAKANTREELTAAFKRKEVYGTSGPRITLRFFGGYGLEGSPVDNGKLSEVGYAKGVPMGADLAPAEGGTAPSFLVAAMKDPQSGNLDRIQIIKGFLDEQGVAQERIYDVAVSDDREIDETGRCKTPVGNTVDLETGRYTNTIGEAQLTATWTDPDFDPDVRAFYYVRVLEIPTPRYSLLDSLALGIDWKETNRPATIQERAYSSPIWYSPES